MDQTEANKRLNELEKNYTESESCDVEIFAEMRSNLLLIAGEHYNKSQSAFFRRIRDSKQINEQQKVRLTKNHIQRITKTYANNIISLAPGVTFSPKNENELQDQKVAEIHHAIWQDFRDRYNLDEKIDEWCDDFIGIGEVHTKIFWDPDQGEIKGFEQALDEEQNPLYTSQEGEDFPHPWHPDTLEPLQPKEGKPIYGGAFVYENIYGFNLLRAAEAKRLDESPFLIVRKMMDKALLKKKFPDQKEKINATSDNTMVVFDPVKGGYYKAQNQVMVKEHYWRPCMEYPRGWYSMQIKDCMLTEDELPGGIFPIVSGLFEKIQTTPRGRSAVKQMRPYQAEINRAASKIAEHQITLGDDKLITLNGSKVSAGVSLPGVRTISATGLAPTILAGRDGSQYLNYMQSQITELYSVMMLVEQDQDKMSQMDPYAMLFMAASQKKKFQRYVKRFERYLIEVAKTSMRLAKIFLPDDLLIYAVGRKEQVNIQEFKNSSDICYQIKVEPQTDDIETKLGKQMALNHLVQYTGSNMSKEDIGKMIRLMPYANMEEGLEDLTIDYDCVTNDILALDRGEMPSIQQYDDHVYAIRRAVLRMRQPDFKFLDQQIQQNYQQYNQGHQEAETERQYQIQLAKSEFIPTGGYLVGCDFYVADPADPAKNRRAKVPYEAVRWLIDKLQAQGQSQDELEKMNQGAVSQMAQMLMQKNGGQQQGAPQQPGGMQPRQAAPPQNMPMQPQGMGPHPGMFR